MIRCAARRNRRAATVPAGAAIAFNWMRRPTVAARRFSFEDMKNPEQKMDDALGLGVWLGRKQAFGLLAGKCSAADAECLRKLRDEKKYRALGMDWETFCRAKIGIGRTAAEKIIRLLEEFGPKYFELSAVVRITPEQYRRIAPAVTGEGLAHRGRLLEIAIDNAAELTEAVDELQREAAPPPRAGASAVPDLERSLERARKSMQGALDAFARVGAAQLEPAARRRLAAHLHDFAIAIFRLSEEQQQEARNRLAG